MIPVLFCLPALVTMHLLLPGIGGVGLQNPNNNLALLCLSFFALFSLTKSGEDLKRFQVPAQIELTTIGLILILVPAALGQTSSWYPVFGVLFWVCIHIASIQTKADLSKRHILWIIFVSGLIEACLGLLQMFGWTPEIDGSVLSNNGIPVGGIQQSNLFASYLCVSIASWAWLMTDGKTAWSSIKQDLMAATGAAVIVAMVILSGSRTGWMAVICVALMGGTALLMAKQQRNLILWTASLGLGVLLAIFLTGLSESGRVAEKAHLESPRWHLYQQALLLARDTPFLGVGYGNFEASYVNSAASAYAAAASDYPAMSNFTHVHNGPLQWYLEGGILGLAGVFMLAIAATLQCRGHTKSITVAYLSFMVPLVLHFLTELPFRQSIVHAWLLIAGVYCMTNSVRSVSVHGTIAISIRGLVLSIFGIALPLFALNNLNSIYWTREINKAPFENGVLAPNIVLPGPMKLPIEYALAKGLFIAGKRRQESTGEFHRMGRR